MITLTILLIVVLLCILVGCLTGLLTLVGVLASLFVGGWAHWPDIWPGALWARKLPLAATS